MAGMAIIVEFETLEGKEEEFTRLISDHARRTLAEEEGCLRFEVLKPVGPDGTPVPNRVMVNELYAGPEAVAAHEANPRLLLVRGATGPLLKSRRLMLSRVLVPAEQDGGLTPEQLNASNDG